FYGLPFLLVALVAGGALPPFILRPRLPRRARLLAWAPSAIGAALLLWSWSQTLPDFQVDEGFRDAVRALDGDAADASDDVARCAVGAGAELFQWYSTRPLTVARTVNEVQQVGRRASELRCIYRPASWESRAATAVRR